MRRAVLRRLAWRPYLHGFWGWPTWAHRETAAVLEAELAPASDPSPESGEQWAAPVLAAPPAGLRPDPGR